MANTVTKQTLVDGQRRLIVKVDIAGDGTGEETGTIIIDASTYSPAFTDCTIKAVQTQIVGFTAKLLFDATTDVTALSVTDGVGSYGISDIIAECGGIPNNAGEGKTGDILITTAGLGAGDHGTIIIDLIKD